MTLKTMTLPLQGKTPDDVLRITRRVLATPQIKKFVISSKGIEISREVEEDENVFNEGTDQLSLEALLERLELETIKFIPGEHGTVTLHRAGQRLADMKLAPTWLVSPSWALLAAWLDLPQGELTPSTVFGFKVVFIPNTERVFLLGAESDMNFMSDTRTAVTIDMGV